MRSDTSLERLRALFEIAGARDPMLTSNCWNGRVVDKVPSRNSVASCSIVGRR